MVPCARPRRAGPEIKQVELGQSSCFITVAIGIASRAIRERGEKHFGGENLMELRTASPRKYVHSRLLNLCAQCGQTIFLPEWSEYLDRQRVRHLWECEACGKVASSRLTASFSPSSAAQDFRVL